MFSTSTYNYKITHIDDNQFTVELITNCKQITTSVGSYLSYHCVGIQFDYCRDINKKQYTIKNIKVRDGIFADAGNRYGISGVDSKAFINLDSILDPNSGITKMSRTNVWYKPTVSISYNQAKNIHSTGKLEFKNEGSVSGFSEYRDTGLTPLTLNFSDDTIPSDVKIKLAYTISATWGANNPATWSENRSIEFSLNSLKIADNVFLPNSKVPECPIKDISAIVSFLGKFPNPRYDCASIDVTTCIDKALSGFRSSDNRFKICYTLLWGVGMNIENRPEEYEEIASSDGVVTRSISVVDGENSPFNYQCKLKIKVYYYSNFCYSNPSDDIIVDMRTPLLADGYPKITVNSADEGSLWVAPATVLIEDCNIVKEALASKSMKLMAMTVKPLDSGKVYFFNPVEECTEISLIEDCITTYEIKLENIHPSVSTERPFYRDYSVEVDSRTPKIEIVESQLSGSILTFKVKSTIKNDVSNSPVHCDWAISTVGESIPIDVIIEFDEEVGDGSCATITVSNIRVGKTYRFNITATNKDSSVGNELSSSILTDEYKRQCGLLLTTVGGESVVVKPEIGVYDEVKDATEFKFCTPMVYDGKGWKSITSDNN